MKTSSSNPKFKEKYVSAHVIHTPQLPGNFEQIRQRAQANYRARGGRLGMTLNDWLKAEQELKQELLKNQQQIEQNYDNHQH